MAFNSDRKLCPSTLIPPLQIPLGQTTTPTQDLRRGFAVSVGHPPQNLSFCVNSWNNMTIIRDNSSSCFFSSPLQCAAYHGGLFDSANSTSWRAAADSEVLPTTGNVDFAFKYAGYANDTLHLNSSFSLANFPLAISNNTDVHVLGLGHSSILLRSLISMGSITSNTWAYFRGWIGSEPVHQLDGSLVLGGYDAAKTTGNNITIPFSQDYSSCKSGMVVTITDIKMNLVNGSNISIIGPSKASALKGCIYLGNTDLSLPLDTWKSFLQVSQVNLLDGSGFLNGGKSISTKGSYDGNLTITVGSNLDIMIPNHQLVIPDYEISESGQTIAQSASSTRELLIEGLEGAYKNDMTHLGQVFFSSAYLFVDNDLKQFTLWKINATEKEDLISIAALSCRDMLPSSSVFGAKIPTLSASTSSFISLSSSASSAPSSNTSLSPAETGNSVSKGLSAGIALSAAVFWSLLLGGFWYLKRWRTRRQAVLEQMTGTNNENTPAGDTHEYPYNKPELSSDTWPPQEMPLAQDTPYDLSPYELESVRKKNDSLKSHAETIHSGTIEIGTSSEGYGQELE